MAPVAMAPVGPRVTVAVTVVAVVVRPPPATPVRAANPTRLLDVRRRRREWRNGHGGCSGCYERSAQRNARGEQCDFAHRHSSEDAPLTGKLGKIFGGTAPVC